jgi:hypothetical protein
MIAAEHSASAAPLVVCEARRVMAQEGCENRAQVTGRASGVALHAVVRSPVELS